MRIACVGVALAAACSGSLAIASDAFVATIAAPAAYAARSDHDDPMIVIDVRSGRERNRVRVGAVDASVPWPGDVPRAFAGAVTDALARHGAARDARVALLCAKGIVAHDAADALVLAGFDRVHVVAGGVDAWRRATAVVAADIAGAPVPRSRRQRAAAAGDVSTSAASQPRTAATLSSR